MKSEPPPLQIGKPCPRQWDDMTGDAKRRFCEHCQLHVHNLSAMSLRERDQFVLASGGGACIAYEFHPDGSLVTPSRWSWLLLPFRRVQRSVAALLAAFLPFFSACATRRTLGKVAHSRDASTHAPSGKQRPAMLLGAVMPTSTGKKQQ